MQNGGRFLWVLSTHIKTLALYKLFTYLLTYVLTSGRSRYANRPEYDTVEVKWILNDACGRHTDSKYVLKCRQVIRIGNLLYAVQVATYNNATSFRCPFPSNIRNSTPEAEVE